MLNPDLIGGPVIGVLISMSILFCSISFVRVEYAEAGKPTACTRAALQKAVDRYLAARKAGDLSRALLAGKVRYVKNMMEIRKEPIETRRHRKSMV